MFKLYCNKNDAHFQEVAILTSGRVGERISFTFSPDWDGLLKTVVFIAGKESRDVVLTEDTCSIPSEVLVFPGEHLRVGVFGETADKTLVIPTIYASAGTIRPGASPSGMSSTPPTPSWPEQVQAIATEAMEVAESVRSDADAGRFKGATGAAGEAGGYYTPSVDDAGNLTWTASKTNMPAVDGANIKGPKGDTGATGAQGPAGATGPAGADGKSAYQYAQDGGFTGTEAEFAAKLAKEIPETLPNPNALTFTGAVTGSYDGSVPVSVKIPEGGSGEAWELIDSVTLSEDVTSVKFNFDTPYKKILFMCQPNVGVSGWKHLSINNGYRIPCANISITSTHALFIEIGAEKRLYQAKDNRVFARVRITVEQISKPENGIIDTYDGVLWVDVASVYFGSKSEMEINSIAMNTATMCKAGAYFEVWGVKA